ncbi:MAG: helix-turn-helix domain-containing protein [Beijerinckiaceae bacterium]|nr:helix-turn-helix domain-containing protein [Beijerinckiaceae bacterium]
MRHSNVKNMLLRRLSSSDFEAIAPDLMLVKMKLKQDIVVPGVPIADILFPESGIISMVAGMDGAERIEVAILGFEGATDQVLEDGDTSSLNSFVQLPGDAYSISAAAYAAWLHDRPTALRLMLRFQQSMSVQIAYTALSHGSFTIEERLSRWLLMCFDRTGSDDLPFVHEFLSTMLAVRRAGVTQAIHVLEGHGAIRATRGMVQLRDRARLEELAAGSYGPPEQAYDRLMGPDLLS